MHITMQFGLEVMRIPPLKHVNDDFISIANNVLQTVDLAVGTLNPDPYTNQNNVKNGSIVTGLELLIDVAWETLNAGSTPDTLDWYVWFNVNGAQTNPTPGATNASHLKNQIFHEEQDMHYVPISGNTVLMPNKLWRAHISIPRGYQQINEGDKIQLCFKKTLSYTCDIKIKCIYKEIFP